MWWIRYRKQQSEARLLRWVKAFQHLWALYDKMPDDPLSEAWMFRNHHRLMRFGKKEP